MINITRAPRGFVLHDDPKLKIAVAWIVQSASQSHVDCSTLRQGDRAGEATSVGHAHIDGEIICGTYNGHRLLGTYVTGTNPRYVISSNGTIDAYYDGVLTYTNKYISYSEGTGSRRMVTWQMTDHKTGEVTENRSVMYLRTFKATEFNLTAFKIAANERQSMLLELPSPGFQQKLQDEACDAATPISSNNIENLSQVRDIITLIATKGKNLSTIVDNSSKFLKRDAADTFKALLGKDIGEHAKCASNGWLAYRYAFSTTVMDIQEHRAGLKAALYQLSHFDKMILHSYASDTIDGWVCTFAMKARPRIHNSMQEAWLKSSAIGLQINTKNLWDLVPYSFVVDWFLPIGDMLSSLNRSVQWREVNYTFLSLTSSCKRVSSWTYLGHSLTETIYHRTAYTEMPNFGVTWKDNTSNRTKVYRSVDAVALTVGQV